MDAFPKTTIASTNGQDRIIPRAAGRARLLPKLGIALAVLLAGAVLIWAKGPAFWTAGRSVPRAQLRTAVVTRGDLVRDIVVQGQVTASSFPTLYTPAEGNVTLAVRPGQQVVKDQVLATIDSPELLSRHRQAEFALEGARAELERLRINAREVNLDHRRVSDLSKLTYEASKRALRRAEVSHKEGLINKADLEKAQDDVAIAKLEYEDGLAAAVLKDEKVAFEVRNQQAQVRRSQLALEELERLVDGLRVRAPVDGLVGNVAVKEGERVAINQALLTVVDLSSFDIQVRIPEAYADDLSSGLATQITLEGKDFSGVLAHISPEVNGGVVVATIAFAGQEPAGLRQNQRVSARILLETKTNVLKLKRGAFLEDFGGSAAYVLKDKLALYQKISVGAMSISEIEIVAGLKEGDTVILSELGRFKSTPSLLVN